MTNHLKKDTKYEQIFDEMHKEDLLYLINGEFDEEGNFVLLAESTKDGELKIIFDDKEYTFKLKKYLPTRLNVQFKPKNKTQVKYRYKFLSSSGCGSLSLDFSEEKANFGLISCNDIGYLDTPNVFGQLKDRTVTFILGDMIYGDSAFYVSGKSMDLDFKGDKNLSNNKIFKEYKDDLTDDQILDRYNELYRYSFHKYQKYLRTGMNIFMPDDHEFYDGFGTKGDEEIPLRMRVAKSAYKAFQRYEMALRLVPKNDEIYIYKKFCDTLYIGIDTRIDRLPREAKNIIFENNIKYEEKPTWISDQQTQWIKDLIRTHKPKTIIVSTATTFNPSSKFALKIAGKFSTDYQEYYGHPRSREQFKEFLKILFHSGAKILAINGDIHKATINQFCYQGKKITELTSSAISREPRGMISLFKNTKEFFLTMLLDTLFKGRSLDEIDQETFPISYGYNGMVFQIKNQKVKIITYCTPPFSYFRALTMQLGLFKDFKTIYKIEGTVDL